MIYLDNNATTAPLPEVQDAVARALCLGPTNPSSPHGAGEPARKLISEARDSVACLIGASSEEVFFTSSGTEANNWVLHIVGLRPKRHLLITPVEHESVLRKAEMLRAQGIIVHELPVDRNGVVCLEAANELITSDIDMVSVQWVNNETGVVQPIERLSSLCKERGVLFHTDAAQAVGKFIVDVHRIKVDYLSFTGHKIHAPMGIGVLYRRQGAPLAPLLGGGMQEFGQRPGSQNLVGIAGIGVASSIRQHRLAEVQTMLKRLRDEFELLVVHACEGACVNTDESVVRVCNTTNIRFPGVDGEALLARLINADICCSQGSACTSQIPEPSHTLLAMGLTNDEAYQSIRFSFSEMNTMKEVKIAAQTIASEYDRMKTIFKKQPNLTGVGSVE